MSAGGAQDKDSMRAESLTVAYDGNVALTDVTFEIKHPSFAVILGPNGSGKTTLLKAMLGMLRPLKGSVRILGYDPLVDQEKVRSIVGYVPQRERVSMEVPLEVRDVVEMGIQIRKGLPRITTADDLRQTSSVLEMVGSSDLEGKLINELSGGQRQRVMIARALASNPKVLFLDEPFIGVDARGQKNIIGLLEELNAEKGISILMVVHDFNILSEHIDVLLLLKNRLISYGPPPEALTQEALEEAYGPGSRVINFAGVCYTMTGDTHHG
jgi:zinc/manganese transport system ATP-binding protein